MRILFVGDVVGRAGRTVLAEKLPGLVADWKLDCVIVNGENSAGGFGITEAIYQEFLDAGGRPRPLDEFELERDQDVRAIDGNGGVYINNFFLSHAAGDRRWFR